MLGLDLGKQGGPGCGVEIKISSFSNTAQPDQISEKWLCVVPFVQCLTLSRNSMFAEWMKTGGAEEMAQYESKRTELWKLTWLRTWPIHTVNLGRAAGSGRESSGLPHGAHLSYFPSLLLCRAFLCFPNWFHLLGLLGKIYPSSRCHALCSVFLHASSSPSPLP